MYMYIYIYTYVCVCVCDEIGKVENGEAKTLTKLEDEIVTCTYVCMYVFMYICVEIVKDENARPKC